MFVYREGAGKNGFDVTTRVDGAASSAKGEGKDLSEKSTFMLGDVKKSGGRRKRLFRDFTWGLCFAERCHE
jgi:hypothetical protein